MKHLVLAAVLAAIVAAILAPGARAMAEPAAAPPPPPEAAAASTERPGLDNAITAFGVFGYLYASTGVGVAGRYQKTIVPQGLLRLPNVHEDLGIEGGLDYYHYGFDGYSLHEFVVLVGVVWNFWFADGRLALYPKLESGIGFGTFSGLNGPALGGYGGFAALAEAGVAYKVSALTLRGEVGSGSLRLGAGFVF